MRGRKIRWIASMLAIGGLLALVMIILATRPGYAAGPWYVAPGGDDGNDCLSPGAPCASISGALVKPGFLPSDTVLVATGMYTGTGDEVVLLDKDAILSGGWDAAFTTQSGTSTIDGEETRRGITVDTGVTAVVDRFTVQNGYTDEGNGGGIYTSGTLTLIDCIISDNFAYYAGYFGHGGGGIYTDGALTLDNSTVSNNTSTDGGGGIYVTNSSSAVIVDSRVYANTAMNWEGGGVQIHEGSDLSMSRSWVVGNAARGNDAGGVGSNNAGLTHIENSIVAGNSASGTGGGLWGDGLFQVINSHIVGNEANGDGGAIAINNSQIKITNTLIISNTGNTGIDDQWDSGAEIWLSHCDTYGNSPDGTGSVTINRTNCLGAPPEDGLDPLMLGGALPDGAGPAYAAEWMNYDYRLLVGSPAIDTGTATGAPATDIEGNPRDAMPDMGAYELMPGVSLSPRSQTGIDEAGSTVAYTIQLGNHTGATDSFDLTLRPGNAWTTILSLPQTDPIADGESLSFTAWVEIPPGASPGEMDSATIQATSNAFPTVYTDTATIGTRVMGDLAYVTLSGSNLVALVDMTAQTAIGSVDVGSAGCQYPWRATMTPDGAHVYVACRSSGDVVVIETASNTVETTIDSIPSAGSIAFVRDGAYALVGSRHNNQVAVVDTATYSVDYISTPSNARSVAAHPYLDLAYATSGDGTVQVIDTTSFNITTAIPVGNDPYDVTVSPDGAWVFTGSRRGDGLAVIDAGSNTVHTTVTGLGDLTGLAVAPDGSMIYASGLWNGLHIIDGATFSYITTIGDVGSPREVAVTCDGGELYVGNRESQVPVVDTGTLSVAERIAMPGDGAQGSAICPQAKQAGVFLVPASQVKYDGPGEVVAYEEHLVNASGRTDSFTLSLAGNVWDTSLSIVDTGPVSDGDSFSFTVWVTIPVSASPGEADSVTVQATSVTSPTVYSDTATIGTHALGNLAYVTLSGSNLVALVDTATHSAIGSVDVGSAGCYFPWRATMSPDGAYVFVSCYNSGNVAVIETAGNTVESTIDSIPSADGIAFTRDGAYALVGSRHNNHVAVVDTATYSVDYISTPSNARSVAAHPYLDAAYATSGDGTIQVIDTTSFSIVTTIPVGNDPWDVAVSSDGQWVFAGSRRGDGLAIIDAGSNTLHTTVTGLGDLTGLEVAPDGSEIYASGLWNGVHVLDGLTFDQITTVWDVGAAWELAVTCDGTELYVGNRENYVSVIDTATREKLQIPMPGSTTRGIAICPQHVAKGVFLSPPAQTNSGARGEMVAYHGILLNITGATDTFSLELGGHTWDTTLSTDSLGPIASGDSAAFTVYVTVPEGADWYSTDTVSVVATSVTSPTVYSDTASFATEAYAPPQISVSPEILTSSQYVNEIADQTLTIGNGNGVDLVFDILSTSLMDDFSTDTGLWDYWGRAYRDESNGYLVLTEPVEQPDDTGIIWSKDEIAQPLVVEFRYRAGGGTGADGFVFMFYKDRDYEPSGGSCLGFGSQASGCTVPGYGIEFDNYHSGGDPSANHIALIKDSPDNHLAYVDDPRTEDNLWHQARIQVGIDSVSVELEGEAILTWEGQIDRSFAGLGFVGATGGLTNWHIIDDVRISFGDDALWLSVDPVTGIAPANNSMPVLVTFDATGLQPGTFGTELVVQSNDPARPLVSVPVSMAVEPTADMGWVEGTVTDKHTGDPLEATIVALGQPYTITADADTGSYLLWLVEGSYTLQVTAEGYVTEMIPVDIKAQRGTVQDVALVRNVPVLQVSPPDLSVTQNPGDVTEQTLTISNDGPVPMDFSIGIGRVPGGAALEFDGTDDQLNMGNSDVLMLSNTDFTVEAWISTTTTSVGWILGKHDAGWGNGYGLTVNHQDCAADKACFDIAGDHMAAISTSDINDGQWHHLAGVYTVSGEKRIYVDGALEDTQPAPVSIPANTDPFRVGYLYDNNCCEQYQGQVDEVRVWDLARTEAEIQGTMNAPLIGNEPGLVGYWRLDEGSGQTAYDKTANSNNGQLGTTPAADPSDPSWFLISPQAGDVLWVTLDLVVGTVPAYSSVSIQVTFDATGMEPGDHTAEIVILSNDPVTPSVVVPVEMTVNNLAPQVTVTPETQDVQYSDLIADITIEALDNVAEVLAASTAWSSDGSSFSPGLPAGLVLTGPSCSDDGVFQTCTWDISGAMSEPASSYTLRTQVSDGYGGATIAEVQISVEPEDAEIWLDSDNPMAMEVDTSLGNSTAFSLTAYVREIVPDEAEFGAEPGDISNAEVEMTLAAVGPGSSYTVACTDVGVTGVGYEQILVVRCDFDDVEVNTYHVQTTVVGGYYAGAPDEAVLVVFDPSLGSTAGGGWFYWPDTADATSGYPGDKTNFGYTMKYNKKGQRVKGSLLLIRHTAEGNYRVKSNALYGLSLGDLEEDGETVGWASFSGKCTYKDRSWEEPEGNHEFLVYVEDWNEPGADHDQLWIEVHDKEGQVILVMSMDRPATDHTVILGGGNIVVPHGAE